MHANTKHGFSLVELSIVLVILGLLVGGILAGQSLIRAAELRAVGTEYQRYVTALSAFRDKYFYLPGDLPNAVSFWTSAAACPGTNATPSTTAATCNGDGDGQIQNVPTSNESYRFWQHLANAELIEGQYSGVADAVTNTDWATRIGFNAPRSKLNNAGWTIFWYGVHDVSDTNNFEGDYRNPLFFGAADAGGLTWFNALKAEEAWNIDTKLDDGKPATGKVVSYENGGGSASTNCSDLAPSSSATRSASVYRLDTTSINCALNFKTGY